MDELGNLTLLKEATNETAFAKIGIQGFLGAGKTYTASEIAIGISKNIGENKPVAFFDTETGSDFVIPKFEKAGIKFFRSKTRSFSDLLEFIKEAEFSGVSVAIIDSITHVWEDLQKSYVTKLGRKNGLLLQDWGNLKKEWGNFRDAFLNSQLHIILCGRAGYEYEHHEQEETGKMELLKTGTKMKAEAEMGYEPSLLLEIEKIQKSDVTKNPKDKGWVHSCTVLKDRTDRINGRTFHNPKYEDFEEFINFLNVGASHVGIDTSRNSQALFEDPDTTWSRTRKRVAIILEEMEGEFVAHDLSGQAKEAKKERVAILKEIFGTSSLTKIESLRLEELEIKFKALKDLLAKRAEPALAEGEKDV